MTEAQFAAEEDRAADDVEAIVTAAVAAGLTASAAARLEAALTGVLRAAVKRAVALGAGPPPRRTLLALRQRTALARAARSLGDIGRPVRDALVIAVRELEMGAEPVKTGGRLGRRLRQIAITTVCRAISAGIEAAARLGGAIGLIWQTDADPCPACKKLGGTTVRLNDRFPSPNGTTWRGYNGRPPLHPSCRCRITAVWSRTHKPNTLRRRARRTRRTENTRG